MRKILIQLTFLFLVGCLGGQDAVEFRGLGQQETVPGGSGLRSIVSSLSVDENRLIISGENLDLVEDMTLYSNSGTTTLSANLAINLKDLHIISQTSERIIATGKSDDVNLYFDGRYDLIRKDFESAVEDVFPFVIIRKEVDTLSDEKVNDQIRLESRHLLPRADDRDVVIYSASLEEWTTGPITGQLEYIGAWDPINNQTWSPKIGQSVTLNETGTDLVIPSPGQYFVVQKECFVFIDAQTTPEAAADPSKICPFGGADPNQNIVTDRMAYRSGDWVVYDGVKWHYINNRGEVESFNGRVGMIEACPNTNCPNVYDYNWELLDKTNSKLSDLTDVKSPSAASDQYVLKVQNGVLSLLEDELGLSEVRTGDIENETLVNDDFGSGLGIDKFDGLQDELDSYIDTVPASGVAEIKGDLNFESTEFSGVNEIETSNGNFEPSKMQSDLNTLDLTSKLDVIDTSSLDLTKKYYLSTDGSGDLKWKELNSKNLLDGATNFYFSEALTQEATPSQDLGMAAGDLGPTDSVKTAFQKLAQKKDDFLSQNASPDFAPRAVTFEKLKQPLDGNGNPENGLLYYDSNTSSWSFMDVSGFNFIEDLDPTDQQAVNNVLNTSHSSGDFYVIEKNGSAQGLVSGVSDFNNGDWVVFDGNEFRKIDYNGKVISLFGDDEIITASSGQYDWSQVVLKPYEIDPTNQIQPGNGDTASKLSDIENVSGAETKDYVLRWNGSEFEIAEDKSGLSGSINGADITDLEDRHFNAAANVNTTKVDGLAGELNNKIDLSSPGVMNGSINFTGGSFVNVNKVGNGTDEILFSDINLGLFIQGLTTKQALLVAPAQGEYFISAAGTFEARSSDSILEIQAGEKFFKEGNVLMLPLRAEDVDASEGSGGAAFSSDPNNPTVITATTPFGEAIDIMKFRVNNRFTNGVTIQSGDIQAESIEPRHFSLSSASVGDHFYFDGADWELREHTSSVTFIEAADDNTVISVSPSEGDYYIVSEANATRTFGTQTLDVNIGDWVMYIKGEWKKITNASPITSFGIGQETPGGSGLFVPTTGDYKLSQLKPDGSKITDLAGANGTPQVGYILKWTGDKWEAQEDQTGTIQVNGTDMAGLDLTINNYKPENTDVDKIPFVKITDFPADYLKKSGATQSLQNDANLNNNKILSVSTVNNVDLSVQKDNYDNFMANKATLELKANTPIDSAAGDAKKFLISVGDNTTREFRELTMDDVDTSGGNYNFYDSDTVFNTPLDGYVLGTDASDVLETDNPLEALSKMENQLKGGAGVETKLYEDSIATNNVVNNVYASKYAVTLDNNNDIFVSSYSIFSLPVPSSVRNGFSVTFKADNGPVYIYPAYEAADAADPPMIEGEHPFFILAEKDAFAHVTYENGHWWLTDSDKTSYSIFKDDKPENCPDGMIGVPGSYLLETEGFCVEKNYTNLNNTNCNNKYEDIRNRCYNIALGSGGGEADVLSARQMSNIFQKMYQSDYNLNSVFNATKTYHFCAKSTPSFGSTTRVIPIGDGEEIIQYKLESNKCSRHNNCPYSKRNRCSPSNPNTSYELLSFDSGLAKNLEITNETCKGSSLENIDFSTKTFNENLFIKSENADVQSSFFDTIQNFHANSYNGICDIDNFLGFSGTSNSYQARTGSYYGAKTYWDPVAEIFAPTSLAGIFDTANAWENKYINFNAIWNSHGEGSRTFKGIAYQLVSGCTSKNYRCAIIPGVFSCTLPQDQTGYDVTSCDTSSGEFLTSAQCGVSCAQGYSSVPGFTVHGNCTPDPGKNNGVFKLKGCYEDQLINSPKNVSSCRSSSVDKSGIYLIDMVSNENQITNDVTVFCEVTKDDAGVITDKYIDVIKTLAVAKDEGRLDEVAAYFFRSNNTSTLEIDIKANDRNQPGIVVRNLGEDAMTDVEIATNGFEIVQSTQTIEEIKMNYRMQGASFDPDACDDLNVGIPLNGPGFDGGSSTSYLSSSYAGFTVEQGTYENKRDSSLNIKDYSKSGITPSTIFAFSGSGTDSEEVPECAKSKFIPQISGLDKPATFFTDLLLKSSSSLKYCKMPSDRKNTVIDCGSVHEDGLYLPDSCSISCENGFSPDPNMSLACFNDGDDFKVYHGCFDENNIYEGDPNIFEPFDYFMPGTTTLNPSWQSDQNFQSKWHTMSCSGSLRLTQQADGNIVFEPSINGLHWGVALRTKEKQMVPTTYSVNALEISFEIHSLDQYGGVDLPGIYFYENEGTMTRQGCGTSRYNRIHGAGKYGSIRFYKKNDVKYMVVDGIFKNVEQATYPWTQYPDYAQLPVLSTLGSNRIKVSFIYSEDGTFIIKQKDLDTGNELAFRGFTENTYDGFSFEVADIDYRMYPSRFDNYISKSYNPIDEGGYLLPPVNISSAYDTSSCDTTSRKLLVRECEITDCASGYYKDPLNPIQVWGDDDTGEFVFKGCHLGEANTVAKKAERLIADRNVLHLDPNHGAHLSVVGADYVHKIDSKENKYGETFEFLSHGDTNSYAIPLKEEAGQKVFEFGGSYDYLKNSDFDHLVNVEKYTSFVVFKPEAKKSYAPLIGSGAIGSIGLNEANGISSYFAANMSIAVQGNDNQVAYPDNYFDNWHTHAAVYDGSKGIVANEFITFIDGEQKNIIDIQPERNQTGSAKGLWVSHYGHRIGNYSYDGDIAEIILFDEVLNQDQITALTNYYNIKYGKIKACTMPSAQALSDAGYASSCDTSLESKSSADCLALTSCKNGYSDNQTYHPLSLICEESGGEFRLLGCYADDEDDAVDALDLTGEDDPTFNQLALRVIKDNAYYWFDPDANGAVTDHSDGKIESITSTEINTTSKTYTASRSSDQYYGSGPLHHEVNGVKYLKFNKLYTERIKNTDLIHKKGTSEFTRFYFFDPQGTGSQMAFSANVTKNFISEYSYSSTFYSGFGKQSHSMTLADFDKIEIFKNGGGKIFTSVFDSSLTGTNAEKFYTRVNQEKINFSTAQAVIAFPEDYEGLIIGGYTNNNYPTEGLIGDIIYFDKKLNTESIELVERYLLEKHQLIKTCKMPQQADLNGYLMYCDTTRQNLTVEECKAEAISNPQLLDNGALTCDTTTHSTASYHPVNIYCPERGGTFELVGCYPIDDPNSSAVESAYTPTDTQKGERIIATRAYYHFDPSDESSIEVEDVGGGVEKIRSWTSQFGQFKFSSSEDKTKLRAVKNNGVISFPTRGWEAQMKAPNIILEKDLSEFSMFSAVNFSKTTYNSFLSSSVNNYVYFGLQSNGNLGLRLGGTTNADLHTDLNGDELKGNMGVLSTVTIKGAVADSFSLINGVKSAITNDVYPHLDIKGLNLGFYYNVSYGFEGDIGDLVFFKEALTEQEAMLVSNYLQKKSGSIMTCHFPKDTQGNLEAPAGYQVYCDTERSDLTVEECLAEASSSGNSDLYDNGDILCDSDYIDNKTYHPITMECNEPGGEFTFRGCYALDEDDAVDAFDKTGEDDPTTEQLALRIIKENSLFHFDPSSGASYVTANAVTKKVTEIKSLLNKNGDQPTLVPNSTDQPTLDTHNGVEMLSITKTDYSQVMKTVGVTLEKGKGSFSVVSVFDKEDSYNGHTGIYRFGDAGNYHFDQTLNYSTGNIWSYSSSGWGSRPSYHYNQSGNSSVDQHSMVTSVYQYDVNAAEKSYVYLNGTKFDTSLYNSGYPEKALNQDYETVLLGQSSYSTSNKFKGHLGEFAVFDKALNDEQAQAVSVYLNKKYGVVKACELPVVRTGYVIDECKTDRGNLTEAECKVTCDPNYTDVSGIISYDDANTVGVIEGKAICSEANGEFEFKGCYLNGAMNNDQAAEALIEQHGVLNLDASKNVESNNGEVTSWTSTVNKNGKQYTFTPFSTSAHASSIEDLNLVPQIYYDDTGDQRLYSASFLEFGSNTDKFQRIMIYKPENNTKKMLVYDNQTGYDGYFSGTSTLYVRSSASSGYNYTGAGVSDLFDGNDLLQTTTFDISGSDNYDKLNTEFLGHTLTLNGNGGSIVAPASTSGMYIGGYYAAGYGYKGSIKHILYVDSHLDENTSATIYSYLKKKNKIGKRCSVPAGQELNIYPKESYMTEDDDLYYPDQLTVACENQDAVLLTVPTVECSVDNGEFTILYCEEPFAPVTSSFESTNPADPETFNDWTTVNNANNTDFTFDSSGASLLATTSSTNSSTIGFSLDYNTTYDLDPTTNLTLPAGGLKFSIKINQYSSQINPSSKIYSGFLVYDPQTALVTSTDNAGNASFEAFNGKSVGATIKIDPNNLTKYKVETAPAGGHHLHAVSLLVSTYSANEIEVLLSPIENNFNNVIIKVKDSVGNLLVNDSIPGMLNISNATAHIFHGTEGESKIEFKEFRVDELPRCILPDATTVSSYDISSCGQTGDLVSEPQCIPECSSATSRTDASGTPIPPLMECSSEGATATFIGCS